MPYVIRPTKAFSGNLVSTCWIDSFKIYSSASIIAVSMTNIKAGYFYWGDDCSKGADEGPGNVFEEMSGRRYSIVVFSSFNYAG